MASVVGAEVVAAEEVLVADGITATIRASGLQLFGFDSLSSPLEWGRGEGLVAAASALRSSLLLFGRPERRLLSLLQWSTAGHPELVVPQALRCGGCSYPRGGTGVLFVMAP